MWPRSGVLHWTHRQIVYVLRFCVWENGMPCGLEMKSNGGLKRRHLPPQPLKTYLHCHNAYGCQTFHGGDLPWGPCEIMWQTQNCYKSTTIMVNCRMVSCLDGHIESHDRFIAWSCEITWQSKTIISPLLRCQWPPNLAGWWLTLRGFYRYSHLTL